MDGVTHEMLVVIAKTLSVLRRRAGFSQSMLASAAEIKLNTLQQLESNMNRHLSARSSKSSSQ